MNWIDTNTLIAICTCAIGLTQFLFWRYISKQKSYESEKGKNLATKEDIAGITKEIESVKSTYNSSLEKYKFDLQKDFETSKFIITLCNSLDNKLVTLISNCLTVFASEGITYLKTDSELIGHIRILYKFIHTYRVRYGSNKQISELMEITSLIYWESEERGTSYDSIPKSNQKRLLMSINDTISLFLPEFMPVTKDPEQ